MNPTASCGSGRFPELSSRKRSLEQFYHGPVWKEFRDDANSTMLDSDNVLLLRPTDPARSAPAPAAIRADVGAQESSEEWMTVSVYSHPPNVDFTQWLPQDLHAAVEQHVGIPVATYRSEPAENKFPALPVRQDNVFVWMAASSCTRKLDSVWWKARCGGTTSRLALRHGSLDANTCGYKVGLRTSVAAPRL